MSSHAKRQAAKPVVGIDFISLRSMNLRSMALLWKIQTDSKGFQKRLFAKDPLLFSLL
jgi:hypothetical protein